MKFTKYFSGIIKNQGVPHITISEYQKVFNIISLENRIDELYRLKNKESSTTRKYRYDIRIKQLEDKLHRLTLENTPQNLLKYMLSKSIF